MAFLDLIGSVAQVTVEVLFNSLLTGIALTALIWGVLRLVPRINATTRYVIWYVTLLAVICLPLFIFISQGAFRTTPTPLNAPVSPVPVEGPSALAPGIQETLPMGEATVSTPVDVETEAQDRVQPAKLRWRSLVWHFPEKGVLFVFGAWLFGVVSLMARLLRSYACLQRLKQISSPLARTDQLRFQQWLKALSVRQRVHLHSSPEIAVPTAVGLIHPVIFLPESLLAQLTEAELDQVVLHELAHLARRDDWSKLMQKLIQAVFFFHPAIAWIGRRLDLEQEVACDDWVIAKLEGDRRSYATCLAKLAELVLNRRQPLLEMGFMTTKTTIERRITMLLDKRRTITARISKVRLLATLGVLIAGVVLFVQVTPVIAVLKQPIPTIFTQLMWKHNEPTSAMGGSGVLKDIDEDGRLEIVTPIYGGNKVLAFNAEDGTLLWDFRVPSWVDPQPALGDIDGDGRLEVVVGSGDGHVYMLNGEDGGFLWKFRTGGAIINSAALGDIDGDGGLDVIVGSADFKVYALNGEDGTLLWDFQTWALGDMGGPALGDIDGDGRLEVVIGSDKTYVLNGEDGTLVWESETGGGSISTLTGRTAIVVAPTIGDINGDGKLEIIIGSDVDHKVYALTGEAGLKIWEFDTGGRVWAEPTLGDVDHDGRLEVIIGSTNWHVFVLNGEDGTKLWEFKAMGQWVFPYAIGDINGDGRLDVIVGTEHYDYRIYALNGEDGTKFWELEEKYHVHDIVLGDIDSDGAVELIVGTWHRSGLGEIYALDITK